MTRATFPTPTPTACRIASVLALLAHGALAQDGSAGLLGTFVLDDGTGPHPVPYAEVSACRQDAPSDCHQSVTDVDGVFGLLDLAPGRYEVEFTHGASGVREVVDVMPSGLTEVEVRAGN